ncbi:MAG: hypothetical protein Fur0020_08080 [Thermodesulfovibrionia bacterium]
MGDILSIKQYTERIISLQKKRDYGSAYNILQEALYYYPSNKFLQALEIYLLLRIGRLKEARQKADMRIVTLKTEPFFLRTYIEILSRVRDKEELIRLSDRLKSKPMGDERIYTYLADVLTRLGERQEAIELLKSGISYLPHSKELVSSLNRLEGGIQKTGVGYYRERYRGLPPERAISEIENILILPDYVNDIPLRLFLAEVYKKTGDLKRASEVYLDCLKIKDDPYARRMLGFVYYRIGEFEKAFYYLKDTLIKNPEDHAVYNTLSRIMERIGNINDAEAMITEALTKHPEARHLYGLLKRVKRFKEGRG